MKKIINTFLLSTIIFSFSFCQQTPPEDLPPSDPLSNQLTIQVPPSSRKVQLTILFDTSNSMDGLIDQAKSRIWSIVNELSNLRHNGQAPTIEIALYQYGNDGLSMTNNYIERVLDLTTDLDEVSAKLFGLTTNGGSEFCGAVIDESLDGLKWSDADTDLKMIYIAGNERFDQGPIDFRTVCEKALKKGVFINTIYCGEYSQGVNELWKEGATCSEGDYFNINSDREIVHIDTPYDVQINHYNDSINTTYFGYGALGNAKKEMQTTQDANAGTMSQEAVTERSIVKSKSATYTNTTWDLLDATNNGLEIEEIAEEDLPEEFKNKTDEEKAVMLEEINTDRTHYQNKIESLAVKRQKYIDTELRKRAEETGEVEDDFGTSVNKSIREKAAELGFSEESKSQIEQ